MGIRDMIRTMREGKDADRKHLVISEAASEEIRSKLAAGGADVDLAFFVPEEWQKYIQATTRC